MQKTIQTIIKSSKNPELLREAFEFAELAYKDKKAPWGELYLQHVAGTALNLQRLNLDTKTIIAGILHDVLELQDQDTETQLKDIQKRFGLEVADIISSFLNLKRIYFSFQISQREKFFEKEKIENVRKMFLAIAKDVRVVLIELASRIDRLHKIKNSPQKTQELYSTETLQVFVPIANRFGLGSIKRELEDLAFEYLLPEDFNWLKNTLRQPYEEREKHLKRFIPHLNKILKKEHIKVVSINYRAKSYWSTWQKLQRNNMDLSKVTDLLALRIVTYDVEGCYKTLGIIHKHFKPISEEIKDYIARPKPNGYRSLHTTIQTNDGDITEIQIRTEEMQQEAEYGICAHWFYKEQDAMHKNEKEFDWVKNVPDFWKTSRIDFFEDRVFAFTPKGDVVDLPMGASVIDFAYAIHSEVGNHCESAKILGKIVPLTYSIKNGDVVEITVNKNKNPSKDWLKFVKTGVAKEHIRKFTGPARSFFRLPIPGFIKQKFTQIVEQRKKAKEEKIKVKKENITQVFLAGQKGILMHIAKCCSPKPGDKVKAYLSKQRAAVIHKTSCSNFKKIAEKFPEKIIDASWE